MLQALQQRYGRRGFRVIGFPCNDFADEEPDDLETIKAFCSREYGVTYELFDKVSIRERQGGKGGKGRDTHSLYRWLTSQPPNPGPVSWNFEKFLLDRKGRLVGRWAPGVSPDDSAITSAIGKALSQE